jgi:hypothetical protein
LATHRLTACGHARPIAAGIGGERTLGVELAAQADRGGARDAQHDRPPPGGRYRRRRAVAQNGCAKRVGHDQATFFGDEHGRKPARHGEIKPVGELPVTAPFMVGAEVGDRGFDLDNDQIACPAEREDIGAAAVGEREFEETGIAPPGERAARPAGQHRRRCRVSGAHRGPESARALLPICLATTNGDR